MQQIQYLCVKIVLSAKMLVEQYAFMHVKLIEECVLIRLVTVIFFLTCTIKMQLFSGRITNPLFDSPW